MMMAEQAGDRSNLEPSAVAAATALSSNASAPKKEKMASLSFAQRRHELASRLARHSRSALHCAALLSAYGYNDPDSATKNDSSNRAETTTKGGRKTPTTAPTAPAATSTSKFPRRGELSHLVSTTSRTFQYVSATQSQADATQDDTAPRQSSRSISFVYSSHSSATFIFSPQCHLHRSMYL